MTQYYSQHDNGLKDKFLLQYPPNGAGPIQRFQFPPKVTTDLMSGNFSELGDGRKTPGLYPGYAYAGPNERYWSIETSYIIDGGSWDNVRVMNEVKKYRTYYFDLVGYMDDNESLIYMKLWGMGAAIQGRAFMRNLSIKHSGPIITPQGESANSQVDKVRQSQNSQSSQSGQGTSIDGYDISYPLRTDVSFDLVYWASFAPFGDAKTKDNPGKESLVQFPEVWY